MRFFYCLLVLFFFQSCSFDNKSGIWKNSDLQKKNENVNFKDFKTITQANEKFFNKIVLAKEKLNFNSNTIEINKEWNDSYFNKNNIYTNFSYSNNNSLYFQSKTLSRKEINNILFKDDLVIISNTKGEIIVYSVSRKKILHEYNFYKKKYKKKTKKLNLILRNNILYVSDNIGYLYSYDYIQNKIIWAKKFDIPFRSNLKIDKQKLFLSDENSNLYVINSKNGNILRKIPTEETLIKNSFINNLSLSDESLYFLNTFGSIYSINKENLKINWFLNINPSLDINLDNLFFSKEVKILNNNLIILNNNYLHVLNSQNGSTKYKVPIQSAISPLVIDDYIFIINNKNLLVLIDNMTGKIIYSLSIEESIAKFLNQNKKKNIQVKLFRIINNEIFVFLKNSYVVRFTINGKLQDIYKLPKKINSNPIFINNFIYYLNNKNKLVILD